MRRRITLLVGTLIVAVVLGWIVIYNTGILNNTETRAQNVVTLQPSDDIQAAIDAQPVGTTFILTAGVYRGQSLTPKDGDTFEGEDGAVLNGAILLTSFEKDSDYWVTTVQDVQPWFSGECMPNFDGCNNAEDVYFDDSPLRHVNTLDEVQAGRWYFDYDTGKVYLGDDPSKKTVELSTTYRAFQGSASKVTIRNLTIEKYAGPGQISAINGEDSTGWVVDNNTVWLNSGVGITIGTKMQVINNRVIRNGQLGVSGIGDDVLVQNNEIAFNNYASYDPGWEAGGTKFVKTNHLRVIGNSVFNNVGPGLWTDIDNIDVTYADNLVVGNASAGIFHEISYDALIENNVVKFNNPTPAEWLYGAQILISSSRNVEVTNNEVAVSASGGNGIAIIQQDRGTGAHGDHLSIQNNVHDNTIYHLGVSGMDGVAGEWPTGDFYADANNSFDYNHYYVVDASHDYWGWSNANRTWAELQAEGQELHGTLTGMVPANAILVQLPSS